jgi:hypothetical protein
MIKPGEWSNYSGAAPLLISVDLLPHWNGFYLPLDKAVPFPDLELPTGQFKTCLDFEFDNPKTDYDRICAQLCSSKGSPAIQTYPVGPGEGLTFSTELDQLAWCETQLMLVNGGDWPKPELKERVDWSDELAWTSLKSEYLLINACDHGTKLGDDTTISIHLEPRDYTIQYGRYGWADDDSSLLLFRFIPR